MALWEGLGLVLLVFKMEERGNEPGNAEGMPKMEKQGRESSLRPSEGMKLCLHFDLSLLGPILDFWPQEL